MVASFERHTDIVQTLIEAKAEINTQNEVCCSYHQKTHCTQHMTTHTVWLYTAVLGEVTVCYSPQDGATALHLAAQEGRVDVVRLLTEAQALVNIRKKVCTSTTLHMSCLINLKSRFLYMVLKEVSSYRNCCLLIQYVQDGRTPLYIASQKGHGAVVKLLLHSHADVSICKKVMPDS